MENSAKGYCNKHYVAYCPDISETCPYCRLRLLQIHLTDMDKFLQGYNTEQCKENGIYHEIVAGMHKHIKAMRRI